MSKTVKYTKTLICVYTSEIKCWKSATFWADAWSQILEILDYCFLKKGSCLSKGHGCLPQRGWYSSPRVFWLSGRGCCISKIGHGLQPFNASYRKARVLKLLDHFNLDGCQTRIKNKCLSLFYQFVPFVQHKSA